MKFRHFVVAAVLALTGATASQAQVVTKFEDISGQIFLGALGTNPNDTSGSVANRFATISDNVSNINGNIGINLTGVEPNGSLGTIETVVAGSINSAMIEFGDEPLEVVNDFTAVGAVAGSLGAITAAFNNGEISGNIDLSASGEVGGLGNIGTTVVGALNSASITAAFVGDSSTTTTP